MSKPTSEKGPYKHYERPTTPRSSSRRRMHGETSEKDSKHIKRNNHTSLWSGIIIVGIIIVAAFPLLFSQLTHSKQNLAEKEIKTTQTTSKKTSKKSSHSSKKSSSQSISKKSSTSISSTVRSSVQSSSQYQASSQSSNSYSQTTQSNSDTNYEQNSRSTSQSRNRKASNGSYTVQTGDTLSEIAAENNISVETLKELNGMTNDIVNPGQVLNVK